MAKKKMLFYTMTLKKNGATVNLEESKKVFRFILSKKNENGSLAIDKTSDRITLDNSFFNGDYFFARLGKEQDIANLAFRSDVNRLTSDLLPDGAKMWVDKLTYVLINFELNIFTIINNQSAPKVSAITTMFSLYAPSYTISLEPVPNEDYYETLYTGGSSISKIRYKMAIPNVDALQNIPGLSKKQFNNLKKMDAEYVEVVISGKPRKILSNNTKAIREIIIDSVEQTDNYEKFEIEGNPPNSSKHTFDLQDEFFGYEINIDNYKIKDGKKTVKTSEELKKDYREKMIEVIRKNKKYLNKFIN